MTVDNWSGRRYFDSTIHRRGGASALIVALNEAARGGFHEYDACVAVSDRRRVWYLPLAFVAEDQLSANAKPPLLLRATDTDVLSLRGQVRRCARGGVYMFAAPQDARLGTTPPTEGLLQAGHGSTAAAGRGGYGRSGVSTHAEGVPRCLPLRQAFAGVPCTEAGWGERWRFS